jgi:hypothetical protein
VKIIGGVKSSSGGTSEAEVCSEAEELRKRRYVPPLPPCTFLDGSAVGTYLRFPQVHKARFPCTFLDGSASSCTCVRVQEGAEPEEAGRGSLFLHSLRGSASSCTCVRVPSTQMSLKCRWSACIACIGVVQYIYVQLGALSFTGT